ncbi:MAG: DUF433 domain-containing protein [Planctomycetes bacterium]|nr:DUF433 domain-containing protein [Planctomycetota bacterium]
MFLRSGRTGASRPPGPDGQPGRQKITIDENVRFGKPVIKGTRIAVATVLGHLAAGDNPDEMAEDYGITKDDVLACLAYALLLVEDEHIQAVW